MKCKIILTVLYFRRRRKKKNFFSNKNRNLLFHQCYSCQSFCIVCRCESLFNNARALAHTHTHTLSLQSPLELTVLSIHYVTVSSLPLSSVSRAVGFLAIVKMNFFFFWMVERIQSRFIVLTLISSIPVFIYRCFPLYLFPHRVNLDFTDADGSTSKFGDAILGGR